MEEKESTVSGSPENTDSGSPTPISGAVVNSGPLVVPPPPVEMSGTPISGGGGMTAGKKKRGRPRKYDAEGNLNPAYAAAAAAKMMAAPPVSPPPGFTLTVPANEYGPPRRGRGRGAHQAQPTSTFQPLAPLGELFANTAGGDFTPHVITVQTGEDVANKIFSFSQKGPIAVCILSANGAISNVTIRQPGSSGGLLTYEGRFEILSLTGSYTVSEAGGVKSRSGGLSISLAGPDGRVVGGSVAGWLTAASPIQVVIGSFVPGGYKPQKRKYHREPATPAPIPAIPETMTTATPTSQAMPGTEAGAPAVPLMQTQSHSEADDSISSGHNLNVVTSHDTAEWNNGSDPSSDHRIYPDINVSVPGV